MMKRLGFLLWLVAALTSCAPAQFIGYSSPQTVQQTLATSLACTGSAQTFTVNNLGQTQHYLSVGSILGATKFQAEIDGVDSAGSVYRISDTLELAGILTTRQGTIFGAGYFPKVQVSVTCSPNTATFNASYSGASATQNQSSGSYLTAQIDKINFFAAPANVNQQDNFQTPFGTSAGTIYFQYNTTSVANGTLTVFCNTAGVASATVAFTVTLPNSNSLQTYVIPDQPCPFAQVTYGSPGGGTTVTAEYVFSVPGKGATVGSSSVSNGQQTVNTAATALASSPLPHGVCLEALSTNSISIFVGGSGSLSTSNGYELKPSAQLCLQVSNSNAIFVVAASTGPVITWVGN
jgi:hypothetical protein